MKTRIRRFFGFGFHRRLADLLPFVGVIAGTTSLLAQGTITFDNPWLDSGTWNYQDYYDSGMWFNLNFTRHP